ncbi:alpha/beta fold hydrolase [Microlunatus ginsengisoli]|uniref:Alpha/beta fold hydrolase n=1 Tax=Microlunatus ginsengisoli TaxID=363863 RepID=A0ABP7APZ2_9ACTN
MNAGQSAAAGAVVAAHQRTGRRIAVQGVETFLLDRGDGEPVVCVHGVPASSFLYRKVLDELAARGLRGIAFDLPGLGLADRPRDFDYSWTGLGRYAAAVVDALDLDRFHLVGHDIGAPVAFELAARRSDRVASLTILNAPVAVGSFRRPLVMKPFAVPGLGEIYLRAVTPAIFRRLMRWQGIADRSKITDAELDAYLLLLRGTDQGRAFLQIMRSFELTQAKDQLYRRVLRDSGLRVQIIWGEADPALPVATRGEQARRAADLPTIHRLPGRHFLQEDNAPALADLIARHVSN